MPGPTKRQKKDASKRTARQDEDDADGSRTPATVSVEGFAVTWSQKAVYYLPMAEIGAAPGCCALLSGVLQDPTAEKARLHITLDQDNFRGHAGHTGSARGPSERSCLNSYCLHSCEPHVSRSSLWRQLCNHACVHAPGI